jgi:DNA-binding MarR family transcriptional regulator
MQSKASSRVPQGWDDSLANPSFQLAVDRLVDAGIIQRFKDGNGQRFIALTPKAKAMSRDRLIEEMING